MNYKVAMGELLARMTLDQRLEMHAREAQNLCQILWGPFDHMTKEQWQSTIFEDIENREYETAIAKATGNWEPPDPPGWEGGFADNH